LETVVRYYSLKENNNLKRIMPDCEMCSKMATYTMEGEPPSLCGVHRAPGMYNYYAEICKFEDCGVFASYGKPGGTRRLYCARHRKEGTVDLTIKLCCMESCTNTKKAIFGYEGEYDRYCSAHRQRGMKDLENKLCSYDGCSVHPNFNYPGATTGVFCKAHSELGMMDVRNRKCAHSGCTINPNFNTPGEKCGLYCAKHKIAGMQNVASKKCIYEGCGKQPTYNIKGETRGLYCSKHCLKDMINVISKRCAYDSCTKIPSYNYKGETKGLYCSVHALEKMENVKSKRCEETGCTKFAHLGPLFGLAKHCWGHKKPNEYKNRVPKCEYKGCKEKPFWSDTNYPKSCESHVKEEYSNIVESECISCGLESYINEVGDGMCNDCSDFITHKVHKVKEKHIGDVLDEHDIKYESADKVVEGGCDKYRPDYVIDNLLYKIIVEVDENQHRSYACECEIGRMISIQQSFFGTPVLFIRYNPDNYTDSGGILRRGGNTNPKREKVLIESIRRLKTFVESGGEWNKPLSVIYLFYDGYDGIQTITDIDYINFSLSEITETLEKIE
jgi:hypothetical protein